MSNTRFSSKPENFVSQIDKLDNLQKLPGTPPNAKKYMDWQWTNTESADVTTMRLKADELFAIVINKRCCPAEKKDELKLLIKSFMAYDHGPIKPHRLLDKIALFGTLPDWESLNIKRGTPLAKKPAKEGMGVINKSFKPSITLRNNFIGGHLLAIIHPEAPESKAPPKGFRCTRVFCYIGTEPPAKLSQYQDIGKARRGLILHQFSDWVVEENAKVFAWYIARYETTKSVLYDPGTPLKVQVFLPTG